MRLAFSRITTIVGGAALLSLSTAATAVMSYDQDVTNNVIFGSGNDNGAFTVDRSQGVELGLRGKLRHNASGLPENTFNSNGDGTYSFNSGVAPGQSFPTAEWSFEWSVNTAYSGLGQLGPGYALDDLQYELGLDSDPGAGTSFITFDPINASSNGTLYWDHAIGTNNTGSGDGTVASTSSEYMALIAENNLAQNSWKPHWFIDPFDPTVAGTYDIYLSASVLGDPIARTDIQILVDGGTSEGSVPVPASIALMAAGLIGFAGFRRRTRR